LKGKAVYQWVTAKGVVLNHWTDGNVLTIRVENWNHRLVKKVANAARLSEYTRSGGVKIRGKSVRIRLCMKHQRSINDVLSLVNIAVDRYATTQADKRHAEPTYKNRRDRLTYPVRAR